MNQAYLDLIRDAGQAAITHIGLVNGSGTEVASGSYARQAVTWTDGETSGAQSIPSADLVFTMTSGDVVAGWRGYSASTGGTDYGGGTLPTVTFSNSGTYTLTASETGIAHTAA